jgi:hypothetical protein
VARQLADHLCAEFDPERFIPDWMKARGTRAEWAALLRAERHELRGAVEVAVLVGDVLESFAHPSSEPAPYHRLRLFYAFAEALTSEADGRDYAAQARLSERFTLEDADRLRAILGDARHAACRRALLIEG